MLQLVEDADNPPAIAGYSATNPAPTTTPDNADLPSTADKTNLSSAATPQSSAGAAALDPQADGDVADHVVDAAHRPSTHPPTPTVVSHVIGEELDSAPALAEKQPLLDTTEGAEPAGMANYLPPGSYPGATMGEHDRNEAANSKGKVPTINNPRPALPGEPKLRFSTIKLDPKYDDFPVLTRMWLAVRDANENHEWITWHNIAVMLDFACWVLPHAWEWLLANPRAMDLVVTVLVKNAWYSVTGALA